MNNLEKLLGLRHIFNNTITNPFQSDDIILIKKLYEDDSNSYNMIFALYEFLVMVKSKEQKFLNNEAILLDAEWYERLVSNYQNLLYNISEFFCTSFKNHEDLLTVSIDNYDLLQFVIGQYIRIDSGVQILLHQPITGQFGEEDILNARHEISRIQSCFLMLIISFQHQSPVVFLPDSREETNHDC